MMSSYVMLFDIKLMFEALLLMEQNMKASRHVLY